MHILVVTGSFPAVSQTFVTREVDAARSRHSVAVLAGRKEPAFAALSPAVQQDCYFHDWRKAAIRLLPFSTWSPRLASAANRRTYGRMLALRRRAFFDRLLAIPGVASADLIHAHWTELAESVALPLGALLGVPVTCTAHDSFLADIPTPTLVHLQQQLSAVAVVSTWSLQEWASRTSSYDRLTVVHNGVDIPPPRQARLVNGRPLVLVNIARCEPHKRQRDLIEAVSLLKARGVLVRCVVVGGGPVLDDLRQLSAERGVQDRCEFTGALSHAEALAVLEGADLFVLPSERESFGVVTAEAMAAGLPVIATAAGGTLDLVDDGLTGYLVPVGTPALIAARVGELVDNPERLLQMGLAGRARAETKFSFDQHMKGMFELWDRAVRHHSDADR